MTEPVISDMMNELVEVVRVAMPDMGNRVTYGAPNNVPGVPMVWFEYNLAVYEAGLLDVALHQAIAIVAVPAKDGAYPEQYRYATDLQQRVRQAVRLSPILDVDAVLVGIESESVRMNAYAGQQDALVAGRLIFTLETKTEITPVYP